MGLIVKRIVPKNNGKPSTLVGRLNPIVYKHEGYNLPHILLIQRSFQRIKDPMVQKTFDLLVDEYWDETARYVKERYSDKLSKLVLIPPTNSSVDIVVISVKFLMLKYLFELKGVSTYGVRDLFMDAYKSMYDLDEDSPIPAGVPIATVSNIASGSGDIGYLNVIFKLVSELKFSDFPMVEYNTFIRTITSVFETATYESGEAGGLMVLSVPGLLSNILANRGQYRLSVSTRLPNTQRDTRVSVLYIHLSVPNSVDIHITSEYAKVGEFTSTSSKIVLDTRVPIRESSIIEVIPETFLEQMVIANIMFDKPFYVMGAPAYIGLLTVGS